MAILLDTNVVIHLRDGDERILKRVERLEDAIVMSVVSRVELEGGVYREPAMAGIRRARLDLLLAAIPALAFDDEAADHYARIVAHVGHSRRRLLDRMIAAQALVHRAELVTMNPDDFADIPGLKLQSWRVAT